MYINVVTNVAAVSLFNSPYSVSPALALSPKFTVKFVQFALVCIYEWLSSSYLPLLGAVVGFQLVTLTFTGDTFKVIPIR